jgi:hypothetical protein
LDQYLADMLVGLAEGLGDQVHLRDLGIVTFDTPIVAFDQQLSAIKGVV